MSFWPFANRTTAKPKRSAPRPAPPQPSAPSKLSAGEKTPSAPGGSVVDRHKRRSSRLQKSASPPPIVRENKTSSLSNAPTSVWDNTNATATYDTYDAKNNTEKQPPTAAAAPLASVPPASPMDVDLDVRRHASTRGSAGDDENITALPSSKSLRASPHLRPVTQEPADILYNWNLRAQSHASLPAHAVTPWSRTKLQRTASQNKRAAQHESPLARRRSSKKRRNDPLREEEIRAMSTPIDVPKRGGDHLLRRESRKSRGPLNRNFERPTSTLSLPFEDSIHSSMSGDAEPRNYRLSVLDVMSPRPAIRFRDRDRNAGRPVASEAVATSLQRKVSHAGRASGKEAVQVWRPTKAEEKAQERARIDSLADEMDSTELRDVLERDRKRKAKKSERDAERLKRKLERRAEKQRTKEWLAQQEEAERESQREVREEAGKDVQMKENVVLDTLGVVGAPEQDLKQKDVHVGEEADFHMEDVAAVDDDDDDDLFVEAAEDKENALYHDPEKTPVPLEDIHPAFRAEYHAAQDTPARGADDGGGEERERTRHDLPTPLSDVQTPMDTPAIESAHAVSYTAARPITPITPVTSSVYYGNRFKASKILGTNVAGGSYTASNTALHEASRLKDVPVHKQPSVARREEHSQRDSDLPLSASTSKKKTGFLASLFRGSRRSVSEMPRQTPEASFASLSREEMSRNIPSHLVHQPSSATSYKKSGLPLRTTSIFREDLPESPLSPPDSRVHSPVDNVVSTRGVSARRAHIPSAIMSEGSSRIGSPDSEPDAAPTTPRSSKVAGLMSQSMGSMDSEASWLSGKSPGSASRARKHGSHGGGSLGRQEDFQGSFEELGIPEDEYFRRLSAPLQAGQPRASNLSVAIASSQHASSTALRSPGLALDADSTATPQTHAGAGRYPVVVHHGSRHKSSEGLLNTYTTGSASRPGTAHRPHVPDDPDKTPEAEYPTPADTPTEERTPDEVAPVQRATSVKLGKGHARSVSAGSAKLLEITRRGSASLSSTPNPPSTPQRSMHNLGGEGSNPPVTRDS